MAAGFDHEWLTAPEARDRITAVARFPADSAWFSGHFPENPILPGVALIALVARTVIGRESRAGRFLAIAGVRRVRFRLPVKPGDEVTLSATEAPGPRGPSFAFSIQLAGEQACSGVLATELISVKNP